MKGPGLVESQTPKGIAKPRDKVTALVLAANGVGEHPTVVPSPHSTFQHCPRVEQDPLQAGATCEGAPGLYKWCHVAQIPAK